MTEFGNSITSIKEYNDLIANHLLDNIDRGILGALPQPTMFGGKRMRKYVLPASTEYDYPSSLSVGHLGTAQPDMLGGSFWSDFGNGLKQGVSAVGQVALPIATELGKEYAREQINNYKSGKGRKRGGAYSRFSIGDNGVMFKVHPPQALQSGGFLVGADGHGVRTMPTTGGSVLGMDNVTPLSNHPTYTGGVHSGGVHSGAGVFDTFKKGFTQVGHALAPVAKEVFQDVVLPEGKEYLKQQLKERRGGTKNSGLVAKIVASRNPAFSVNKIKRPSGNLVNYAKLMGEKYTGSYKPSDLWNTFKGKNVPKKKGTKASKKKLIIENDSESEGEEENVVIPAPKAKRGRKPKALPKGQMDIRTMLQGKGMYGGSVLDDLGKVSQAVAPFLPLLAGLGRGEPMPPHPCGGNWADDLGKVSQIIAPFAPLLMAMGREPEMYGGDVLGDIGKVTQAVAPFLPLLLGLGRARRRVPRGGNFLDDLGKVSSAIAPFAPLLMGLGKPKKSKKGGVLIKDVPSQFHTNTGLMPPALASYNPPVPSVSGSGRKPSERGAIVKRIMAEKGMSLPQASKYVKEHGLYKK